MINYGEVLLFVSTLLDLEVQRRGLKVLSASLSSSPSRAIIHGGMCLYRLTRTIRSFDVLLLIQNVSSFKPPANFLWQAPVGQIWKIFVDVIKCSKNG